MDTTSKRRLALALLPGLGVIPAWMLGFWPLIGYVLAWWAWAVVMASWPELQQRLHRLREQRRQPEERCAVCRAALHLQSVYEQLTTSAGEL